MWPFTEPYPERTVQDVAGKTYDYIIVGGGTAGCVIASRLSEDPDVSVLVIERGRVKDNLLSRIPLLSSNFLFPHLQVVGDRFSQPIATCHDRRVALWGAEGLGGSSRINGMQITRGPPGVYNEWASELGLDDWSFDKVMPYFKKIENCKTHVGKSYHGYDGPVANKVVPPPFKFYQYLEKSCEALGLSVQRDHNAPDAPAQGYYDLALAVDDRSERISAYTAYLNKKVALQRRNRLTVCTGAVVSKLVVDKKSKWATGVKIQAGAAGKDVEVHARREVIVCGGAFRTPQLLLLSGIGPKSKLSPHGITQVHDLPQVGANLYDHYSFPLNMEVPMSESLHGVTRALMAVWHLILYFFWFGAGLMGMPTNRSAVFVRTSSLESSTMRSRVRPDEDDASTAAAVPDIEIMLNAVNSVTMLLPEKSMLCLYTTLLRPASVGGVDLVSADPMAHPRVDYAMLSDPAGADLAAMRAGTRFALRMADALRQSGYPHPVPLIYGPGMDPAELEIITTQEPQPAPTAAPRPGAPEYRLLAPKPELKTLRLSPVQTAWDAVSDDAIDAYARRVAITSLHFSCTCRMSAGGPEDGVVDQRLRVHGLRGLRIADASVFPRIPAAHTMAPVMMVAERCADFLKEDWRERKVQ